VTSQEEIPDGHWMIKSVESEDILFHSDNLDKVIDKIKEFDEEGVYVEPNNVTFSTKR